MAKFCPSCGKPNDDAAGFCVSCGAAFPAQAAPPPAAPPPATPPAASAYGAPPPAGPPPAGPFAGPAIPPAAPGGPEATAPGGGSRTPLIILIVLLIAAAIAVACYFLFLRGSGDKGTPSSPSPSASTSASASANATGSASPSPTATVAEGETCAAVQGVKADSIGAFDFHGGFVQLVPAGGKPLSEVAWSPDGRYLAYLRMKKQWSLEATLMVCDTSDGSTGPVSFGSLVPEAIYGYTWVSPTRLVAAAVKALGGGAKRNGDLYLCDVAAGTAEPLKDASGNALKGLEPSASADGKLLVFDSFGPKISSTSIAEKLQLADLGSGAVKTVRSGQVDTIVEGYNFNEPRLSPDGQAIFAESVGSDVGFAATVYATDGAILLRTDYLMYPSGGAWDPSGSGRLAFGAHRSESGPNLLYMYDPGSDGLVTVAKVRGRFLDGVTWSPDGKTIYYTLISPTNDYRTDDLWAIGVGGAGRKLVDRDTGWPALKKGGLGPSASEGSSPTPAPSSTP